MPNKVVKDADEIELDLDDLDDAIKPAEKESPKRGREKPSRRSRSRSVSSDDSRHA